MRRFAKVIIVLAISIAAARTPAQTNTFASDPLLDLLIKKGYISADEAKNVRAEASVNQTNNTSIGKTKWAVGIKNGEFFGDVRLRYENREAWTPNGSRFELDRLRYALRFGIHANLVENFYFGFRVETASNPRSSWVNFATSTSGVPFQGPWGKSSGGIGVGQLYIGYKPRPWADITLGKMQNPLYTTPMLWDPDDINPEGAAERFNFKLGDAEVFANFTQRLYYEDVNCLTRSAEFLVPTFPSGSDTPAPWQFAWQIGANYHINDDIAARAAATLYNYTSVGGGKALDSSAGAVFEPSPGLQWAVRWRGDDETG